VDPSGVRRRYDRRMPQREVELILVRQLASSLAVPIFLVDEQGVMVYFNEPAEVLLGQRFDELGDLPVEGWRRLFGLRDDGGQPLPTDQAPVIVALTERRPVHRRVRIFGLDGVDRAVEVTAFPLVGPGGHLIGGVAMFWERRQA
jgi:PAS domain-containing protein